MEWIVALPVFVLALALLPVALGATKRSSSRAKGRLGGMVMGIGLAFWAVLDPSARTTVEEIDRNRDTGRRNQEDAEGSG